MPSAPRPAAPSHFAGKAWQQVLARDHAADGQFVYAVKSTGIYCKPSCPSRRPERKNVTFFPTPALAEAAGFRACLRCEPSLAAPRPDPQAPAIARAAEFLADHAGQRTTLDELASAAGLGRFALQRGFKRVLGVTPGEFAREERLKKFRDRVKPKPSAPNQRQEAQNTRQGQLKKQENTVTTAIYDAGFGSSSRLYETADATLGMTPTAMKLGGAGETIRYAIDNSALGPILVAQTDRGLCAVLFADTEAEATIALRERFPQAVLRPDSAQLADSIAFVLSQLTEHPTAQTLPFHVPATAFQQRVWRALLAIPRGETRTYAQIAQSIGAPAAVRAVGTACGANPLALVVPCHRVLATDGRLAGYRWGTDRKRMILNIESDHSPAPSV